WRTEMPEGWEEPALHLDTALHAVATERLVAAQKIFADGHFAAQVEANKIRERITLIDSNLQRLDQGLSPIEEGTRALLRQLQSACAGLPRLQGRPADHGGDDGSRRHLRERDHAGPDDELRQDGQAHAASPASQARSRQRGGDASTASGRTCGPRPATRRKG